MSEVKTNKISSLASNNDITLDPDGTGKVAIPAAVEVDSNDITVAFDGADDVNSLILQGSNGSSEKFTMQFQADGAGSAAKFMVGSGGGSASEKMRLEANNFIIGKTSSSFGTKGARFLLSSGTLGQLELTTDGQDILNLNRLNSDGSILRIFQDSSMEGQISVSGTTVSYEGGHLARWSRLADNSKDTSIVKGTVMTNLDQMVVWTHAATDDKAEWTEDNEQLNCMAVSSVEGDANVAGVFVNWDAGDDFNDMTVAMTGDMVIRIAQGTTVARGDLLMSAGDGTAKPQDDDIVRSKTIAKVTSTNVSHTYDDGSYLVPCVLMAC